VLALSDAAWPGSYAALAPSRTTSAASGCEGREAGSIPATRTATTTASAPLKLMVQADPVVDNGAARTCPEGHMKTTQRIARAKTR
jgi:hypothetical protein